MKTAWKLLVLLILVAGCAQPVRLADSRIGRWQVMTSGKGTKNMLCYAGTTPVTSAAFLARRSEPYLMITRRPSGKIEISASSGYPYPKDSEVALSIDGRKYRLFFKDSVAWAKTEGADKIIFENLSGAQRIELRGVSEGGVASYDDFSAEGFVGAFARIKALCP